VNTIVNTGDNAVMAEVSAGQVAQLAVLFERHHRALFRYFVSMSGHREAAEDLVQDVFFRILRYRTSYNPAQSFTAWMYQIARNARVDTIRKRKFEVELGDKEFPSASLMDENLKRKQELSLLKRAMERLPQEKRELLVLSRFQNLKYEEIAAILDCSVGAVKVRVYRAVQSLGQIYSELAGERAS
jgi:RNA polymerase sigma-70 factor (ECF subfamily)